MKSVIKLMFALSILLLTGCDVKCGRKQFSQMPDGPLRSYYYLQEAPLGGADTLTYVRLERCDSLASGGLLTVYRNDMPSQLNLKSPVVVDEDVFDHCLQLIEENEIYALCTWYKTDWKGDAYGYAPWTIEICFGSDTLCSVSDGSSPPGQYYSQYGAVNDYLIEMVEAQNYARLAAADLSLDDFAYFWSQDYDLLRILNDDGELCADEFELKERSSDSIVATYKLVDDGHNKFRDTKNGCTMQLRFAERNVELVCTAADGTELWTLSPVFADQE